MKIVLDTSVRPSCYCYTTRTVCVMKIVLDTSIRPSCYCYTTRTVCHENRAGHKYTSIVLLLHDTHIFMTHCACRVTVTRWTDTCVQHDFHDTLCVSCNSNTMDGYLCPARFS